MARIRIPKIMYAVYFIACAFVIILRIMYLSVFYSVILSGAKDPVILRMWDSSTRFARSE